MDLIEAKELYDKTIALGVYNKNILQQLTLAVFGEDLTKSTNYKTIIHQLNRYFKFDFTNALMKQVSQPTTTQPVKPSEPVVLVDIKPKKKAKKKNNDLSDNNHSV